MAEDHGNKNTGPPPAYGSQVVSPQSTVGPYHHDGHNYGPPALYNNHSDLRAPESVYSGSAAGGVYPSPPPGGYYAPTNNFYGHPAQGPPPNGYYGPPPPPQQPMYYAAPYGPPVMYQQDTRGTSAATGICGAILGSLALCCCLDLFLF